MSIKITATPAQDAAVSRLVAEWPQHEASIDLVRTDERGRIWVRFTHPVHTYHYYILNADGTHGGAFEGSYDVSTPHPDGGHAL